MKLTKKRLDQIINEELNMLLNEVDPAAATSAPTKSQVTAADKEWEDYQQLHISPKRKPGKYADAPWQHASTGDQAPIVRSATAKKKQRRFKPPGKKAFGL